MRSLLIYILLIPLNLLTQTVLPVYKDGNWGLINENGELVIDYQYQEIGQCFNDCFTYRKDSLWYISNLEKEFSPKGYHKVEFQNELILGVHNGTKDIFSLKGDFLLKARKVQIDVIDTVIREIWTGEQSLVYNLRFEKSCQCDRFSLVRTKIYRCTKGDSTFILDSMMNIQQRFSKDAKFQTISSITAVTQDSLKSIFLSKDMTFISDSITSIQTVTYPLIGLILTRNGKQAIYALQDQKFSLDFKYSRVELFRDYIRVSKDTLKGIVSLEGEEIVPLEYENVYATSNGYRVVKNGLHGVYANKSLIIPCRYTSIWETVTGYLLYKGALQGYASRNGEVIEQTKYKRVLENEGSILCIKQDSGCVQFLVNEKGQVLGEKLEFDRVMMLSVSPTYTSTTGARAQADTIGWLTRNVRSTRRNNFRAPRFRYYYRDSAGKILAPPLYQFLQPISSNYTMATSNKKETITLHGFSLKLNQMDLWNISDERFDQRAYLNMNYNDVLDTSKVGIRINHSNRIGVLNKNSGAFDSLNAIAQYGKNYLVAYSPFEDFVTARSGLSFNDNFYQDFLRQNYPFATFDRFSSTYRLKSVKYGIYDSTLTLKVPIIYDRLEKPLNATVIATNSQNQGLIDLANETIIPFQNWKLARFRGQHDSLIIISESAPSEAFLVDQELNLVDHMQTKTVFKRFNNKYIYIHQGKLFGVIDNDGNEVLPVSFSRIKKFKKGYAIIREGKYSYIVDENFKIMNSQGYRKILENSADYFVVEKKGIKHLLNYKGDTIFEEIRKQITPVSNGWICHSNYKNASIYLNKTLHKEFVNILYAEEDKVVYSIKKKTYVLDTQNEVVIPLKNAHVVQCNRKGYITQTKDSYHFIKWDTDSATYSSKRKLSFSKKGYLIEKVDGKDVLIDSSGNTFLSKRNHEYQEYLIYRAEGKLCIHNKATGITITTERISKVIAVSNGIILCQMKNYIYFNLQGERLFTEGYSHATPFYSDYAKVTLKGVSYLMHISGSLHSTFNARKLVPAYANYFHLYPLQLVGLYDDQGVEILPIKYHAIRYMGNNIIQVTYLNQLGYFNLSTKTWIKSL